MKPTRYIPRDANGRLHPSAKARRKVLYCCSDCGWELVQHEAKPLKKPRNPERRGDLYHYRRGPVRPGVSRWCGPVQFMLNPAYRKQCG